MRYPLDPLAAQPSNAPEVRATDAADAAGSDGDLRRRLQADAARAAAALREAGGERKEPQAERAPRRSRVQPGRDLREERAARDPARQVAAGVQLPVRRHPRLNEAGGPHQTLPELQGRAPLGRPSRPGSPRRRRPSPKAAALLRPQFKHRILVSTDIWGRGIDIERVNIVVNYDMPDARSRSRSRACPRAEAHHLATFAYAGVGHVPAPRGARRPLRHQGPRYHVRLDRRGCEDPRGRAVSFRGVHHAPAGVDRCHVIHVRAPARLRSPPPPLPAPARLSVRVRASAHPRRQPPDTLIHPGRTA